jgi:hypothetical protein
MPEAAADAWKTKAVSPNQLPLFFENSSIILLCDITIVLNNMKIVNDSEKNVAKQHIASFPPGNFPQGRQTQHPNE